MQTGSRCGRVDVEYRGRVVVLVYLLIGDNLEHEHFRGGVFQSGV